MLFCYFWEVINMLMTYQELLQTDNWRQKRQEILLRDDHKCQRCGVSKNNTDLDSKLLFMGKGGDLIDKSFDFCFFENPNSNVSLVSIKYANKVEMICKTDIYKSTINKNHTYVIVENFVEKDFIKYPFNGTTEPQIKDNIFLKNDTNESLITYIRDKVIKDERIDVDLEGFFLIEYGIEHYVSKNKFSLHVHHKCYRKDVDIWAQDNDDYITLCNICHM